MKNSLQEPQPPLTPVPEDKDKVIEKKDGDLDPIPDERAPVRDPVISPVIPQKV